MSRKLLITGTVFITIGIILGALGAHTLKTIISAEQVASFKTGVQYQLFNGLGLLVLGLNAEKLKPFKLKMSFWLIVIGTILFSLSIYLLATGNVTGIISLSGIIGPLTPIGGLFMISGWGFMIWGFIFG